MQNLLTLVGAALVLVGCAPAPPPLVDESDAVRYYSARSDCANHAEAVELALTRLSSVLGVPLPEEPIYYYHVDAATVQAVCGSAATGCTDGTAVWSQLQLYQHELVHVLLHRDGWSSKVLDEGAAVVFGSGFWESSTVVAPSDELLDWLYRDAADSSADFYLLSASFVRFVIDAWGLDAFLALHECVPAGSSAARLDSCFVDVLGDPPTQVVSDWVDRGSVPVFEVVRPTLECASPGISAEWSTLELECGFGTGNVVSDQWVEFRSLDVEDPDSAAVSVRAAHPHELGLVVDGCDASAPVVQLPPAAEPVFEAERNERVLVWTGAGTYSVRPFVRDGSEATVEVSARVGPWMSNACEETVAYDIGPSTAELTVTTDKSWMRIRADVDVEACLHLLIPPGTDLELEVYGADCATAEAVVGHGECVPLGAGREYVLRLDEALGSGVRLRLRSPG